MKLPDIKEYPLPEGMEYLVRMFGSYKGLCIISSEIKNNNDMPLYYAWAVTAPFGGGAIPVAEKEEFVAITTPDGKGEAAAPSATITIHKSEDEAFHCMYQRVLLGM